MNFNNRWTSKSLNLLNLDFDLLKGWRPGEWQGCVLSNRMCPVECSVIARLERQTVRSKPEILLSNFIWYNDIQISSMISWSSIYCLLLWKLRRKFEAVINTFMGYIFSIILICFESFKSMSKYWSMQNPCITYI